MKSALDRLRDEDRGAVLALTAAERVALALALGERDLEAFRRARALPRRRGPHPRPPEAVWSPGLGLSGRPHRVTLLGSARCACGLAKAAGRWMSSSAGAAGCPECSSGRRRVRSTASTYRSPDGLTCSCSRSTPAALRTPGTSSN